MTAALPLYAKARRLVKNRQNKFVLLWEVTKNKIKIKNILIYKKQSDMLPTKEKLFNLMKKWLIQ